MNKNCNPIDNNSIFFKQPIERYDGSFSKLTKREKECLFYLLKGLTAKEIARVMDISNRTIETHVGNIKMKLGVRKKSEVMIQAFQQGFPFLGINYYKLVADAIT